jgi:transcriptional regulator with XRE-family HTH domain
VGNRTPGNSLADRLREARNGAGLSQEATAAKAGVSTATVARLERGEHTPQVATLEAIATALGTTASKLLGVRTAA